MVVDAGASVSGNYQSVDNISLLNANTLHHRDEGYGYNRVRLYGKATTLGGTEITPSASLENEHSSLLVYWK